MERSRKITGIACIAMLIASVCSTQPAYSFGLGGATRNQSKSTELLFIREKRRSIEPFAHVVFCTQSPGECAASSGPDRVDLTIDKKRELMSVNREVNRQINPRNDSAEAIDVWSLAPRSGDCEDYAITKRHALIQQGWPASALRLAVAQTSWGEGHLVLIVRTSKGDMVLDNRTDAIRNWRKTGLRWHMIQSAGNPRIWFNI